MVNRESHCDKLYVRSNGAFCFLLSVIPCCAMSHHMWSIDAVPSEAGHFDCVVLPSWPCSLMLVLHAVLSFCSPCRFARAALSFWLLFRFCTISTCNFARSLCVSFAFRFAAHMTARFCSAAIQVDSAAQSFSQPTKISFALFLASARHHIPVPVDLQSAASSGYENLRGL